MALKFRVKSKEEVSVEHLPFYVQRDGSAALRAGLRAEGCEGRNMTLNYKVARIDEVPAEPRGCCLERDGAFVLDVEAVYWRNSLPVRRFTGDTSLSTERLSEA